mmetsp:Transcript_15520/g.33601  ORF Transcript_15520/g.33601 Transcript_15520/m.33601 type:complete len:215 (-) Transcript_15520:363-1007(-)
MPRSALTSPPALSCSSQLPSASFFADTGNLLATTSKRCAPSLSTPSPSRSPSRSMECFADGDSGPRPSLASGSPLNDGVLHMFRGCFSSSWLRLTLLRVRRISRCFSKRSTRVEVTVREHMSIDVFLLSCLASLLAFSSFLFLASRSRDHRRLLNMSSITSSTFFPPSLGLSSIFLAGARIRSREKGHRDPDFEARSPSHHSATQHLPPLHIPG